MNIVTEKIDSPMVICVRDMVKRINGKTFEVCRFIVKKVANVLKTLCRN